MRSLNFYLALSILVFTSLGQAESGWNSITADCKTKLNDKYLFKGDFDREWGGHRQWSLSELSSDYAANPIDGCLSAALPLALNDAFDWDAYYGEFTGCASRYTNPKDYEKLDSSSKNCSEDDFKKFSANHNYVMTIADAISNYQGGTANAIMLRMKKHLKDIGADPDLAEASSLDVTLEGNIACAEEGNCHPQDGKDKKSNLSDLKDITAAVADAPADDDDGDPFEFVPPPVPPGFSDFKEERSAPLKTDSANSELGGGNVKSAPAQTGVEKILNANESYKKEMAPICKKLNIPTEYQAGVVTVDDDEFFNDCTKFVLDRGNAALYGTLIYDEDLELPDYAYSLVNTTKPRMEFLRNLRHLKEVDEVKLSEYDDQMQKTIDQYGTENVGECFNSAGKQYYSCYNLSKKAFSIGASGMAYLTACATVGKYKAVCSKLHGVIKKGAALGGSKTWSVFTANKGLNEFLKKSYNVIRHPIKTVKGTKAAAPVVNATQKPLSKELEALKKITDKAKADEEAAVQRALELKKIRDAQRNAH